MALLGARVIELEREVQEAGVLTLFEEPKMISLQLPNRPHPVACSFFQPPGAHGLIILDLQIGGLSSRSLALAGHTTMEEADITGTTLSFGPLMTVEEFERGDCPLPDSQKLMLEEIFRSRQERVWTAARPPGKAPGEPDAEDLETLAFAFQGILQAFRASSLSPSDVWETPRKILEIRVSASTAGDSDGRSAGDAAREEVDVSWEHVPFDPIQMAPYPAARLDRSLRRRPMHGKRSWILHMIPMHVSDATTHDTIQTLFALDARSGDIVGQETAQDGTADSIGRCMESILEETGYRPGSAITTSPRLDDILGEGLQSLNIRYVKRKRLKASDPRVQDLEDFMRWAQPKMMADMMAEADGGESGSVET